MARDCCPVLWTKCGGVWSADNFHLEISSGGNRNNHANLCDSMTFHFQIVNSARSNDVGRHWILLIVAAVPMNTTKNNDQYPQQQQQQGLVGYKTVNTRAWCLCGIAWVCLSDNIRTFLNAWSFFFCSRHKCWRFIKLAYPFKLPPQTCAVCIVSIWPII